MSGACKLGQNTSSSSHSYEEISSPGSAFTWGIGAGSVQPWLFLPPGRCHSVVDWLIGYGWISELGGHHASNLFQRAWMNGRMDLCM